MNENMEKKMDIIAEVKEELKDLENQIHSLEEAENK